MFLPSFIFDLPLAAWSETALKKNKKKKTAQRKKEEGEPLLPLGADEYEENIIRYIRG